MCFPRKPALGHYNATRSEWLAAYRNARIVESRGARAPTNVGGVAWKAHLIVAFDRKTPDELEMPVTSRLATNRLIDEILAESITQELESR